MARHHWFVGPLEALLERLPRAIARPVGSVIVLIYFHWTRLLIGLMIASVAGVLGFVLWADLPPDEAKPALFLLIGLALFALWQWREADRLRQSLRSLEDELREEDTIEYEYPNGDTV